MTFFFWGGGGERTVQFQGSCLIEMEKQEPKPTRSLVLRTFPTESSDVFILLTGTWDALPFYGGGGGGDIRQTRHLCRNFRWESRTLMISITYFLAKKKRKTNTYNNKKICSKICRHKLEFIFFRSFFYVCVCGEGGGVDCTGLMCLWSYFILILKFLCFLSNIILKKLWISYAPKAHEQEKSHRHLYHYFQRQQRLGSQHWPCLLRRCPGQMKPPSPRICLRLRYSWCPPPHWHSLHSRCL